MVDIIKNNEIDPLFVCANECYWWCKETGNLFDSRGKILSWFNKRDVILLDTLLKRPDELVSIAVLQETIFDDFDDISTFEAEINMRKRVSRLRSKLRILDSELPDKIYAKHNGYMWKSRFIDLNNN